MCQIDTKQINTLGDLEMELDNEVKDMERDLT
jgi:hypothetical protein